MTEQAWGLTAVISQPYGDSDCIYGYDQTDFFAARLIRSNRRHYAGPNEATNNDGAAKCRLFSQASYL